MFTFSKSARQYFIDILNFSVPNLKACYPLQHNANRAIITIKYIPKNSISETTCIVLIQCNMANRPLRKQVILVWDVALLFLGQTSLKMSLVHVVYHFSLGIAILSHFQQLTLEMSSTRAISVGNVTSSDKGRVPYVFQMILLLMGRSCGGRWTLFSAKYIEVNAAVIPFRKTVPWKPCTYKTIASSQNGVGRGYLVAVTGSTWQKVRDVRGCYMVYVASFQLCRGHTFA